MTTRWVVRAATTEPAGEKSIPVRVTKNDKSELVRNEQSVRICFLSKIGVQIAFPISQPGGWLTFN